MAKIFSPDLTIVLTKLDRLASQIPGEAEKSTRKFAEQILWDSDNIPPVVPVKTGDLRSTGHVEKVGSVSPAQYAVVYGGASPTGGFVDYAEQVHDDLRERRWRRPGSGPKFVEAHIESRIPEADFFIGDGIRTIIKEEFGE